MLLRKKEEKTFWVLLVIFLVIVGCVSFWYLKNRGRPDVKKREMGEEHKKLLEESKKYAMRQHIKHVEEGERYNKHCSICNDSW